MHALRGLCTLTGSRVGMTIDMAGVQPGERPTVFDPLEVGFDDDQRRRLIAYYTSDEVAEDPGTRALASAHQSRRFLTRRRQEMVDSNAWYASPTVSEARRSGNVDHFVCSTIGRGPADTLDGFILYRDWGAAPYGDHHRKLLRLFHAELIKRMQLPGAASPFQLPPVLASLPPHLRQVLASLLKGESAREAAKSLGRSYHTVRSYTKALYDRLQVSSREDLVDKLLKGPHGRVILPAWALRT